MYFFTADEHYLHENAIKYSNRPFQNKEEMTEGIISRHNKVVKKNDIVVHAGDTSLAKIEFVEPIISRLNGTHIFLKGSHDR